MNAVVERKPDAIAVTPTSDSAALIQVIAQAARDPSVDINKMERLMAMHERLQAREAEKAFNVAMTACQLEMKPISADAENTQTRSKYATFTKLDQYMRPIYTSHGFALSFDEADAPGKVETVRVVCYVSHVGGHTRTYHRDMPADGKGAKGGDVMTKTHAAGAAGSYGARYLLKGIFNVAIGEWDDDGNLGNGNGKRLDENAYADFLANIDAASDEKSLGAAFAKSWKAAEAINDMRSMRKFGERKEARKKALGIR